MCIKKIINKIDKRWLRVLIRHDIDRLTFLFGAVDKLQRPLRLCNPLVPAVPVPLQPEHQTRRDLLRGHLLHEQLQRRNLHCGGL